MASTKGIRKDESLEDNNFENFETNFETITPKYNITNESKIDEVDLLNTAKRIVNRFSIITETNYDHALIGCCALLQCGSYLRSVPNRTINVQNKDFSKQELVFAAQQANSNYTLRAVARSMRRIIAKIAIKYRIPGNLYAQFKLQNPQFIPDKDPKETAEIMAYCTDFQYDNPEIPKTVKEFLSNRQTKK